MVTALVLAASLGSGVLTTIFALTAFFTPSFTRVVRAAALSVLQEDFITASRLYGRGRAFILARHVLPNIAGVLIVQFTLYFAAGILTEAGLSYLGVGVTRPNISWGLMLSEAQNQVGVSSPLAMWPGLAIVLVVLGLNLLGDGLRDVLDPKLTRKPA
jgi:peptide/nickel transport system permease protein